MSGIMAIIKEDNQSQVSQSVLTFIYELKAPGSVRNPQSLVTTWVWSSKQSSGEAKHASINQAD